jgi:LPXTG-motif cell wall-anchored protein
MRRGLAALAAGAALAAATAAPAGAGTDGISGSANWSVAFAEPGATVTLTGGYQSGAPDPATYVIQLSITGGGTGLITSFTTSANLPTAGCTATDGTTITCTWNATTQNETATITATVVVPSGPIGDPLEGNATYQDMLLGQDVFEIVAPSPTIPATTSTTTTVPVTTAPGETPTTVESTTTTAAASGGGTATTRPRPSELPATGSSSPQLVIAAIVTLLAGVLVVVAARRRPLH